MTRLDLHIHTALSACGENTMSPTQVLRSARRRNVHVLAVTDHNATEAACLTHRLAKGADIVVLPGIEIATREEVHLLALFDEPDPLRELARIIDAHLPSALNDETLFGYQLIYDENDEIVGVDEQLRQTAVNLGLDRLVDEIHALGGLAIPAHVFRPRNSLVSQLGFIDPDAAFDAVEIRPRYWRTGEYRLGDRVEGFPVMTGPDAHFLEDIGRHSMELPGRVVSTTADIRAALR